MRIDQKSDDREVLEFDFGVRVYPPAKGGGYWRIRWEERHRGRDTTARHRAAAITKASAIVGRPARSAPTARARGAELVAHGPVVALHGRDDRTAPVGYVQDLASMLAAVGRSIGVRVVEGDHHLTIRRPCVVAAAVAECAGA